MAKNYDIRIPSSLLEPPSILPRLTSLEKISCNRVKAMVESAHEKISKEADNLDAEVSKLRVYFLQLPAIIRTSLLEEFRMARYGLYTEDYLMCFFSLQLLFSKGVAKVGISFGKTFWQKHFDSLLELLSNEGNSLVNLSLCDSFRFRNCRFSLMNYHQLTKVLLIAENLAALTLENVCDDTVLKIIGLECTRLRFLSPFYDMTEKGYNFLTQNILRVELGSKTEAICKSSMWKYWDIFLPLEDLVPKGHTPEDYQRKRSPLCDTLKTLVVDTEGEIPVESDVECIMMILELIPGLESFGALEMQEFFERIHSDLVRFGGQVEELPRLNLTSILVSTASKETLALINWMCPQLRSLDIGRSFFHNTESLIPIASLNSITHLRSLTVSCWYQQNACNIYDLSPELKANIEYLEVIDHDWKIPFDLQRLMSEFQSLHTLYLLLETFTWRKELESPDMKHKNLKSITLYGNVSFESLLSILQCTPNAEKLQVDEILQKPEDFLPRFCKEVKLPKLKSLTDLSGLLDTEQELSYLLSHFPSINVVGELNFLNDTDEEDSEQQ